jgi:hypothetical protein
MSLRYDLSGVAGFDQTFNFSLTSSGAPLNLTGYTLALYLKASAITPDALATVYGEGTGLTWDAPAADTAISAPGALWYRVDVIDSSSVAAPASYGALNLVAA